MTVSTIPTKPKSGWSQLPDDLFPQIISFLPPKDSVKVSQVSKDWKSTAQKEVAEIFLRRLVPIQEAISNCTSSQRPPFMPQSLVKNEDLPTNHLVAELNQFAQKILDNSKKILSSRDLSLVIPDTNDNRVFPEKAAQAAFSKFSSSAFPFALNLAPGDIVALSLSSPKTRASDLADALRQDLGPKYIILPRRNVGLLPPQIENARVLDVSGNKITMTSLDCQMVEKQPLVSLDLSENPINPEWEADLNAQLPSLEQLILKKCGLSSLPPLCKCENLRNLDLGENKFDYFPLSLQMLPKLAFLDLIKNPITSESLSTFIKQIAEDIKNPYTGERVRTANFLRIKVNPGVLNPSQISELKESVKFPYQLTHVSSEYDRCDFFELRRAL